MDIELVLQRADVTWRDDPITGKRIVTCRNKEHPLTEKEKDTIRRMWSAQMIFPLEVVFE